jgi:hypothetical protein
VTITFPTVNQQFFAGERSLIGYSATDPDGGRTFTQRWTVKFGGQEKTVSIAVIGGFNTFVPSDYIHGNTKCPGRTETAELWVYVTDAQGQVGTAHIPFRVVYPPC